MDKDEQIRLMQEVIEQLNANIRIQNERIAEKDATIAELKNLVDELQSMRANLEETLAEFRRHFFGVRSEKTKKKKEENEGKEQEEGESVQVRAHERTRKTKSTRDEIYAGLPSREVVIPLPEDQKHCEYCNAEMVVIGKTKVREEIRITPAKVERIVYMQESAICPECKKDGDVGIVKAAVPKALLPHSPASPSAVAYIIYEKTFLALPYYRQESSMFQLGLNLPRETMANWYITCAEKYFYPIYDRMHQNLVKREVLHADETTCQVLREKGKMPESTSYMWIYMTGSDGLSPIILYDYQPGRGGKYRKILMMGINSRISGEVNN